MSGRVRHIHVADSQGAPPVAVDAVEAVTGAGLRGDRYFQDDGTFTDRAGSELTLIEVEALAAAERALDIRLPPGVHRRNVTTVNISLELLLDQPFRIGEAICLGTEPCDPCSYLERHLEKRGIQAALVDRGGLRCRILDGGVIRVGDDIELADDNEIDK